MKRAESLLEETRHQARPPLERFRPTVYKSTEGSQRGSLTRNVVEESDEHESVNELFRIGVVTVVFSESRTNHRKTNSSMKYLSERSVQYNNDLRTWTDTKRGAVFFNDAEQESGSEFFSSIVERLEADKQLPGTVYVFYTNDASSVHGRTGTVCEKSATEFSSKVAIVKRCSHNSRRFYVCTGGRAEVGEQKAKMQVPVLTAVTILAILSAWAASSSLPQTLRQVHVYFRHGQRTPASTYPHDPFIHEKFTPYGWGQLTNEGKRQQYEQGQWLRQRYDNFLGHWFSTEETEARATGVDRTKMSLMLAMAGLWPPHGNQIWNEQLLWQPVPYSAEELNKDTLLLVRSCPRYSEAFDALLATEKVKAKVEEYKDLYEYLTEHTGANVSLPEGVEDIYSTLKAEEDFGLELPEWTKKVYPEPMKTVTALNFMLNAYNTELKKIKAGPMVKKLLKDTESFIDGKSKKKFFANAGHDSTVSNLMMGLSIWEKQVPVYNIMAIIELHEIGGTHGFKFFLRNTTDHEPYQLTLPGCEPFCPLDSVKKAVQSILPEERETMCKVHDASYTASAEGGP